MNQMIRGLGSKRAYLEFQLKRIAGSISRLVIINKGANADLNIPITRFKREQRGRMDC
jgi:hypothetical protein